MRKLACALPVAISLLLLAAVDAAADAPDLVAATLEGPWHLLVTVESYTGPVDLLPGAVTPRPVGHQAIDTVWFQPACQAPGSCAVRIWGPGGPSAAQNSYYQYFSNSSGFEGTSADQPLLQSGTAYSSTVVIGGFGGLKCPPPTTPRPAQQLVLHVTDAKRSSILSGWLATTVTGTEVLVSGWGCSGGQATGWRTETLSILGHPVGYALPAPRSGTLTVSSLASALNPPGQAFRTPPLIAVNLLVTALVILFVTFPPALFNHTLSENYDEISAATRWLRSAWTPLRELSSRAGAGRIGRRRDTLLFAAVLLVGALLNGLLDPTFGFDVRSATSYLATLMTICFGVAVTGGVAFLYRRLRRQDTRWHPRALPLGLGIAALCVLVTRLTDFAPGYFYGFVCGIAFGTALGRREAGHTAALATIASMTLAVVAWLGWAALYPSVQTGAGWPVVFAEDFLGSVFVGGLVGNVVGLLPLRSLQGGTLIAWHRGVWGAIFGVAVFGLIQVLLHPEQGAVHPSGAPVLTAILLFAGFGGGSIAFNRYFTWGGRPTRLAIPVEAAPLPAAPHA